MDSNNTITSKLWEVQIDLLNKFKDICKKHGLQYYACAGTLLGAARHKGFIPWDDDIDVALMWPDYKMLLEVAPQECEYPYYFQSYLNEKCGEVNACRLRRSDTTGFTKWEYENVGPNYNKGIFIDIFPLFNVPDSLEKRNIQKEKVLYYWRCIRGHDALYQKQRGIPVNEDYAPFIPLFLEASSKMSIIELKTAYLEACALEPIPQAEIGATASRVHKSQLMWNTEWFDESVELHFENTTVNCPKEYEKVLEKQYGDWKTPVMNGAMHEMVVVDTETPYVEYLRLHPELL